MNAALRKALEERASAWSKVQDIRSRREAAGFSATDEDNETYTRALDDVERFERVVENEERAERLGSSIDTPAPGQGEGNPREGRSDEARAAEYRGAFDRYLRRDIGSLNGEQRELLERGFIEATKDEQRALGASVDAAGGFTVPKEFLARMVEKRKAFGGIAALADDLSTGDGREFSWPTNDSTAAEGAILDENTEDTEQDTTFGSAKIKAYMYTSKVVRLSRQLLQDSAFDMETWLAGKLGERIGRITARHFAVGNGTTQPQGLLTGTTKISTSGTVGKISYEDTVDLEHSIDPAYRESPNVRYVLNDSVVREYRKLKDTTGRPLWVPALAGGTPSTINGRPYTVDNSLPEFAAGAKSVLFGDIKSAFLVRTVLGGQTLRLGERYATSLQIGFLGFQRFDAVVQDTAAVAALLTKV